MALPLIYVGLAAYVFLFRFEVAWIVVLCASAVVAAAAAWAQFRAGDARASRGMAAALKPLRAVPLPLLALPLPLYVSWLAATTARSDPATADYTLALGLWLAAIALFVGLLMPWNRVLSWAASPSLRAVPWPEVGAVCLLTAVALIIRAVNLETEPNPYSGDEANFALQALRMERGEVDNIFTTHVPFAQPSLFAAIINLSFKAFGTGVLSSRLVAVVFGVATIPLAYLLLREAFGRSVALVGTAFLAVYDLHVHWSRLSMNNITGPFIAVLALYFTARAVRTRSALDFGLAGAASALSLYSYVGARVVPIVVGVWLGYAALTNLRAWKSYAVGAGVLVVGFVVVALPQGLLYWEHHSDFLASQQWANIFASGWLADEASVRNQSQARILLDQFREGFGVLTVYGERYHHYNSGVPLVGTLSGALFVLGGVYSLFRLRRPEYLGLLSLLVLTVLLGAALATPPPSSARLVTIIPAVAAFVGLGAVGVARFMAWWRPWLSPLGPLLLAALILAMAGLNLHFYFGDYLPAERYSGGNTDITEAAGKYLVELGDDYVGYWFGAPWIGTMDPTFAFLTRDRTTVNVPENPTRLPQPGVDKPGAVFMFMLARQGELDYVQDACPGGTFREFWDTAEDRILFVSYEMPQANGCVERVRFVATTGS
jgi:4-amino-4-deoxy-L-arabinose transferase-like glycosyltransferase